MTYDGYFIRTKSLRDILVDAGVGGSALGKIYESTFKEQGGKYYDEQIRNHQ